ncbi:hypothetical protein NDU88_007364 [Pleurodeles waltl]|uniref:Uncharacterized protein n=1 Tax=Pleurodeles waltl TaxID=8319 RepID=A0AAV7MFK1_PLEWA|nr:hypothetical protein NDU88_007364 [Pleurodeles waltl]
MHRSVPGVVCYQALASSGVQAGGHAPVRPWMEVCYQALAGSGVPAGGHAPVSPWMEVCYQALAGSGVPAGGHAPVSSWSGLLSSTGRPLGCRLVDMHRLAHGVVCYQALASSGVLAGGHAPDGPWTTLLSSTGQLWGAGWWTCTGRLMDCSVIKHWQTLGCRLVDMHRSAYGVEVCYQALAGPGVPAGGHAPVGPWSGGQLSSTGRPWGAGWWTCTGQPMEWRSVIKHWQALGCWLVDMHPSVHGWRSVIKYWPALGCRPVDMHRSAHGVVCYQALAGLGGEGWWTCTGRPMEWSVIKHWPALGCRLVDMHQSVHGWRSVIKHWQALGCRLVDMHRSAHGWRSVIKHWQALGCRLVDMHRSALGVVCYQALAGPWGAGWWTCTGWPMEWSVIKH